MQHHITIPSIIAGQILKQRRWLLAGIVVITGLAMWQISRTPFSISAVESFTADFETFQKYQIRAENFGGDTDCLVFAATDEGQDLFTAKVFNGLRAVSEQLAALPEVKRVIALTDVPVFNGEPGSPLAEMARSAIRQQLLQGKAPVLPRSVEMKPWWPRDAKEQESLDLGQLRSKMLADQQIVGRLISKDGSSQCMLIQLKPERVGLNAKWRLRRQINDALLEHGLGRNQLHVSGMAITEGWILSELYSSLFLQFPIGIAVIAALVYGLYRSALIAVLTIVVGGVAATWAVAFTGLVFGKITILVAAVPLLILVISTGNTIHLISAYAQEVAKSGLRDQALHDLICEVGGACILTSLTTLVGFLSLLMVPVIAIRHLAVAAGAGVALSLILAVSAIPIGIVWLNFQPPKNDDRSNSLIGRIIDAIVRGCQTISLKFPKTIVLLHLGAVVVAIFIARNLTFDPNLPKRFGDNHPLVQSIDFFNNRFMGTNSVEIFIQGSREELLCPDALNSYARLQRQLESLPEIKSVTSVNDIFNWIDRAIDYQNAGSLPESVETACASLSLVHQVYPDATETLITENLDQTRITAYTTLTGFFEVLQLSREIDKIVQREIASKLSPEVSGVMPVIAQSIERIVDSQFSGMLFCFAIVSIMMMVALRSIRMGLISLPPNIFPLALLAGILTIGTRFVDSDYIIIFTIAFGIAVDDTIHFLHRYDIEFNLCRDQVAALKRTFGYSGRAIVQTTVLLGLGLLPLALAKYLTIWILGTYLVLTLIIALVADLLLLPALILLFGEKVPASPRFTGADSS